MYGFEVFHENMLSSLINSVRLGEINNAYIFEGSKGLFKHNSAHLLATAITCENTQNAPCGICSSCTHSMSNTNPDIIHISLDGKKSIGVDKIRDIAQDVAIKPFESARKVYIIDDGDAFTEASQNAFLKTLEEPPSYVSFIIVIENSSTLLQTVLSRCILLRFSPVSDKRIEDYIDKKYPNEQRKKFLIKYVAGIPGTVDNIISDDDFELVRKDSYDMLPALLSPHKISAYKVVQFFEENKEKIDLILDFWISFLRDIMLIHSELNDLVINTDMIDKLKRVSGRLDEKFILIAIEKLLNAKNMHRRYVNTRAMALNLTLSIKKAAE